MRLYLVRHGKARRESPSGRDADRPLARLGARQARHLGRVIACADEPPVLCLCSGHTRAMQTAQLICSGLRRSDIRCPIETAKELESGRSESDVIHLIRMRSDAQCLMLVGHNPQLEIACAALTRNTDAPLTRLRTGEAVLLDTDGERTCILGRFRLDG